MRRPRTAKTDFTPEMLPATRREVFFDVVKLQFGKLALCGLLALGFTLPFLFSTMAQDLFQSVLYQRVAEGTLTEGAAAVYATSYQNLFPLVEVLCYLLLSVGLAGLSRIVKRLAWEENVSLGADFAKGVKQNGKQYALLGLLAGLAAFLGRYVANLSGGTWWGYLPGLLMAVVLGPAAAYLTVTIAVYDLKFRDQVKYALILYSKSIPKTLLAAALCYLPFVPQLLPNVYCHTIGRLVSGILIPFVMLAWFLFAYDRLDKDINPGRYPELLGRGLYRPEGLTER